MDDARLREAREVMLRFADATGLSSDRPARRYLWTDAFAVCNFVGLCRATGEARYGELALRLIDQVHHELGRHRSGDHRTGWISGLTDAEGEAHPTRGGLRIGKPLPERGATEPLQPDLEWHRDGQYFHYLTKWMHALDQAARWNGDPKLHVWARELALAAHAAFAYGPPGNRKMRWKLSVNLSRPLVSSMGQHDPLDGWVTCEVLEAGGPDLLAEPSPSLREVVLDFASMLEPDALATGDSLGIGGLLVDVCRLAQIDRGHELLEPLLAASMAGLAHYLAEQEWRVPADRRLAFRELGLAIGVGGVSRFEAEIAAHLSRTSSGRTCLAELSRCLPLKDELESFWLDREHRGGPSWVEHADINDVMLATCLAPEGFLERARLERPGSKR